MSDTLEQLDNVTNSWKDVVNLQDSSALMRFTYTVVNLTANTAYKYRIRLVMEDSHKPLPSIPSPESSKWIITNCSGLYSYALEALVSARVIVNFLASL